MGVTRELSPVLMRQFLHSYCLLVESNSLNSCAILCDLRDLPRLRLGKIIKSRPRRGFKPLVENLFTTH